MLMVEMLARMPDLRRRIQTEHIADSTGHCRDCHGAQWPCELYRLASEVDRRYGPCPGGASWGGPPRQVRPGALPAQAAHWPAPPIAAPPPVRGAIGPAARAAPPPARSAPPPPLRPAGSAPLPPPRSPSAPPGIHPSAILQPYGMPSGRAPGAALPAPRGGTGGFPPVPAGPRTPTALSVRHDELRARREQHRARRDELRARRGEVDRWRDGGRHDLGRPVERLARPERLSPVLPQPKSELIDVLEDVLRWTH
ncbi:MAG TPA: hypothetical protein VGD73_16525 [Pseudonocardia sp.]|uniref:hypothetical protein n=1 Tax=Pseudonocardia sp. TaxID=60912 RepID=UPI002EDA6E07